MICVQTEDFDLGAESRALVAGNHQVGGLALFVGLVREMLPGVEQSMTLEHYPGMTEQQLEAIEAEAKARWPLEATLIIHRVGRLEPGDQIVLVAAASAHRQAAFEAAEFLMDYLKTKAPFWKKEEAGGEAQWVDARESDDTALERWR